MPKLSPCVICKKSFRRTQYPGTEYPGLCRHCLKNESLRDQGIAIYDSLDPLERTLYYHYLLEVSGLREFHDHYISLADVPYILIAWVENTFGTMDYENYTKPPEWSRKKVSHVE